MKKSSKKQNGNYLDEKAPLSWDIHDFENLDDEPPPCVACGRTEGEIMEKEDIEPWCKETLTVLSVIKEDHPERFAGVYNSFILDLDYLESLGKITKEESEILRHKDNFKFE